jgi:putative nucleotidyltransferase with HDIG domain
MTRDEALEELKIRLSDKDVLRHSLAVEAVMKEFARHYNADADIWGMAGLLHDIDHDKTVNNPSLHGIVGADILENLDIDGAIVYSVRAHNDCNDIPRKRKMDKVLVLAGFICELIIKCTLMFPDKKISEISTEFVIKKMHEKEFEQIVHKDKIKYLEELGFTIEEFITTTLMAIQGISQELAL